MSAGRNPTRRNRNIGTAKRGHGKDNRLTIPRKSSAPVFFEDVGDHRVIRRRIGEQDVGFVVERTREDCIHCCTVDDIAHLLAAVPNKDWSGIEIVFLRQPTRKQQVLSNVWGRLIYFAEIAGLEGAMIVLEALDLSKPRKWSRSLGPDDTAELDRLRQAGHRIEATRRRMLIHSSLESARATQLYHTILHEIGHWVDFKRSVEGPIDRGERADEDYGALCDRYWARPGQEKEAFAHRYADETAAALRRKGIIPFDRKIDLDLLAAENLAVNDFLEIERERHRG